MIRAIVLVLFISVTIIPANPIGETIQSITTSSTVIRVPEDYPTLQGAINAADSGDIIIVSEGTYAEGNIYVWKPVTLIANDTVIVDGLYQGNVFSISTHNVTIKGFTVKNSNPEYPSMGISLVGARNVVVEGNTVTNNYYGIELYYSVNNTIVNNTVTNNHEGIELFYSRNNNITGNRAENNWGAIPFHRSHNNTVAYNNVVNNSWGAIGLRESDDNNIVGNNVTYSRYGIWLNASDRNNIAQNGITNAEYSIGLDESNGNNIVQNNVANNEHAIGFSNSSNNIYYNNFINNTEQVYSEDSLNVWDNGYPSGGNYWRDYTGLDLYSGLYQNETGSDGIGDTAYTIDANNADRFPLMGPISVFNAGTWNETTYYVNLSSNSTVSDFHFSPDDRLFIRFNVTALNGNVGFCRVMIPKQLFWVENARWSVLVDDEPVVPKIIEDGIYTYVYFNYVIYKPSTKNVRIIRQVIPEFPLALVLLLLILFVLIAIPLIRRYTIRKTTKTRPLEILNPSV